MWSNVRKYGTLLSNVEQYQKSWHIAQQCKAMSRKYSTLLSNNKQRKEDLLGPYGMYFEEFKSQLPMPSRLQSPPPQPDFGTTSPWEVMKSEKKQKKEKEKSEDQEFTYQNLIPENPNIETSNFQTQQNLNLENPEIETPNFQMQPN
ncbi:hypothetical protein G9A89_016056 [Geosiphon pyriformis]|nr:hypothetical protein G9A89_016056 [Geosiphon pyriformis]